MHPDRHSQHGELHTEASLSGGYGCIELVRGEEMLSLSRGYMYKGNGLGPFKHDIAWDQCLRQGLWDFF